jgi:RNA polymerase sigma factor (sigma-70 family)
VQTTSEEFEQLIETYAKVMSSAIRRVCGRRNKALIPDVEQEVRLALWKRFRSGKKIEHPASYLYKAALTTALAVLQRQLRGEPAVEPEVLESLAASAEEPADLLPAERASLLSQLLGKLPAQQTYALRAHLAGFNHKEVAVLLGSTESVARHRIYRGMEALRDRVRGHRRGA